MTDILSLFASSEAAMRFIKKTAKVTYTLLIANSVATLFDLAEWYKVIDNIPHTNRVHHFYNYTIYPVIYILNIIILLAGSVFNYKGFAQLKEIDIAGDDLQITRAFKYFYYAYLLFLIATCTLLIERF